MVSVIQTLINYSSTDIKFICKMYTYQVTNTSGSTNIEHPFQHKTQWKFNIQLPHKSTL